VLEARAPLAGSCVSTMVGMDDGLRKRKVQKDFGAPAHADKKARPAANRHRETSH
jgi:hypothetical protein